MKMHLYRVKDRTIEAIPYDDFINTYKDNEGIDKWILMRKTLINHPHRYGNARFVVEVKENEEYYFCSGLSKDMLEKMLGFKNTTETKNIQEKITTKYFKNKEVWDTELKKYVKEIYPVDEILKGKVGDYILKYMDTKRKYILLDGDKIKISSYRLRLFKIKGPNCCVCGLKGKYFYKSRNAGDNCYHLELFGIKDGKLVELTKDHILPKSKGGADHLANLQPMCADCNVQKGNNINLKDKMKGISKVDLCLSKLGAIKKLCQENYNSKMTKQQLCSQIFDIIKIKSTKGLDNNKSILKRLSKLIGIN